MKKLRCIAVIAAVLLVLSGIIIKLSGIDRTVDIKPGLPLDTVITGEQAQQDLKYVYDTVTANHPAFLTDGNAERKFSGAYLAMLGELSKKDSITVCELWEMTARLCCTLDDAHTIMTTSGDRYVSGADKLLEAANNGTLVSIDGIATDEMLAHFKQVFPYEPQVEFYADYMFLSAIQMDSWLTLLGANTADGIDAVIGENGEIVHFDMADEPDESDSYELCSYEIDKENSLGIFTLNKCSVTDEYTSCLAEFFDKVRENGIENIAVDLRNNGGGTTQVINEFMRYIDVTDYKLFGGVDIRTEAGIVSYRDELTPNVRVENPFGGNVYVLTSNYTFSSAMDFAVVIQDNGIGKVIGDIPGNMPTAYGDKLTFQCPNSRLLVSVSYKKFHRVDTKKDELPLIPDVQVDAASAEEKLYEIISEK